MLRSGGKNPLAMQETPGQFLGWEDPLEKGWATHSSILGLPCGLAGKESICNAEDMGSTPGMGKAPAEGKSYPFQYSCLENSMDCIVHGVTKSWTWLTHFHSEQSVVSIGQSERDKNCVINYFGDLDAVL